MMKDSMESLPTNFIIFHSWALYDENFFQIPGGPSHFSSPYLAEEAQSHGTNWPEISVAVEPNVGQGAGARN
jgi:hypothetical protein